MESYKTYLDNIVNNVPGAIYWKDVNGFYLGCNHLEAKIAGLESPEEIVGKTDYDLCWKDTAHILRCTDNRIMETQKPEEIIESVKSAGKNIVLLTNKSPLYNDDGEVIGIIGTSIDITARVEAEEREKMAQLAKVNVEAQIKIEEEVKRSVMVLAGSISHDLRTPLVTLSMINARLKNYISLFSTSGNSITGSSHHDPKIILDDLSSMPDAIAELVQNMHLYIDHNLKAIKHCQDASIAEESLVICKSYKSINNALSAYPFREGEAQFVQADTTNSFDFLGNPILFLRILFNLINNSLYQININGQGQIFISCEQGSDHNIIRFKDTGGGAPTSVVEHIFDGYVTTKEKGTGVGLAFCKLTMASFGGTIECHAQEGDFIEFILKFPKVSH